MNQRAKYHGHRDKNHLPITAVFPKHGWQIQDVSGVAGFVDAIAVRERDQLAVIIEIKRLDGEFSIKQLEFLSTWAGHAAILMDEAGAEMLCSNPSKACLTLAQKDALGAFCYRARADGADSKKRFSVGVVMKVLNPNR